MPPRRATILRLGPLVLGPRDYDFVCLWQGHAHHWPQALQSRSARTRVADVVEPVFVAGEGKAFRRQDDICLEMNTQVKGDCPTQYTDAFES
jgi:hypothetical protein